MGMSKKKMMEDEDKKARDKEVKRMKLIDMTDSDIWHLYLDYCRNFYTDEEDIEEEDFEEEDVEALEN